MQAIFFNKDAYLDTLLSLFIDDSKRVPGEDIIKESFLPDNMASSVRKEEELGKLLSRLKQGLAFHPKLCFYSTM